MSSPPSLLMVNAFIGTAGYKKLYQELGYAVVTEWSERRAISLVRKTPPAVIVADFYHQTDFRDRLSNLESLLATAQGMPHTRILVFYEAAHQAVLDKVCQRLRIDIALPMPVDEADLRATLTSWFDCC
ncbi:MAG: hypothetical protein LT080_05565 [Thiobacillus sp.]|nr:hypothetical protein [Thiobacillus sp.]